LRFQLRIWLREQGHRSDRQHLDVRNLRQQRGGGPAGSRMTSAYLHNMGLILDMTKKIEFTKDEALAAKKMMKDVAYHEKVGLTAFSENTQAQRDELQVAYKSFCKQVDKVKLQVTDAS
jgi:hypothetical protein